MKSKYSRKQMTPGMKYCKDTYGSKSGRIGTPFTKSSCSPFKEADANLVNAASEIASNDINAVVSGKTDTEKALELGVNEANRQLDQHDVDFKVNAEQYGYSTDKQIQDNLNANL